MMTGFLQQAVSALAMTSTAMTVAVMTVPVMALSGNAAGTPQSCPEHLASVLFESSHSVAVSGWVALIGTDHGVSAVDVSDPESPRRLGALLLDGRAQDMAVAGSYAYVASAGLQLIDHSDPVQLRHVDSIPCDSPNSLSLAGDYLYAGTVHGLCIVDIADPGHPSVVSELTLDGLSFTVAVGNNHAYLAAKDSGVFVVDVSDAAAPEQVGRVTLAGNHWSLAASGATVYAAAGHFGNALVTIDASEPSQPRIVDNQSTRTTSGMLIVGDHLIELGDRIRVYDISSPLSPQLVERVYLDGSKMAVQDGIGYLVAYNVNLHTLDFANIEDPTLLATLDLPLLPREVIVAGEYLLVATSEGLVVLDDSDPAAPYEVASSWFFDALAIALVDDQAYLARGDKGLKVLDISDPLTPEYSGTFDTTGPALDLALDGRHLYVGTGSGLEVVEVSDPEQPLSLAGLSLPGQAHQVCLWGRHAFIAADTAGLRIVDISDPSQPFETGFVETPGTAVGVAVSGGVAYIADLDQGLFMVEVSDAEHPLVVGSRPTQREVTGVAVSSGLASDLLVVAEGDWRAQRIFDLSSSRRDPVEVAAIDLLAGSMRVSMSGALTFFCSKSGVHIYATGECQQQYSTWLEIAAHQQGSYGSTWVSDLIIDNTNASQAPLELVLHSQDGEHRASGSVSAGTQGVVEDVVSEMGAGGVGALELRSDRPLAMVGRIVSISAEGSFGQQLVGRTEAEGLISGDTARLLGLRQYQDVYRSNLSITNTSELPATVEISLYATDGRLLHFYRHTIAATQVWQDIEPFRRRAGAPNLGWGFARVEVVAGSGILTSASVIDSRTNDATSIPMIKGPMIKGPSR